MASPSFHFDTKPTLQSVPQKIRRVWITGLKWIYTQSHTHTQTYIIMNAISEKRRRNYKVLKLKQLYASSHCQSKHLAPLIMEVGKRTFRLKRCFIMAFYIWNNVHGYTIQLSWLLVYHHEKKKMLLVQRPKLSIPHLPPQYLLISRHIAILFVSSCAFFLLPYHCTFFGKEGPILIISLWWPGMLKGFGG